MRGALSLLLALAVAGCAGPPLPADRRDRAMGMGKPRPRSDGKHGSEAIREPADPETVSGQGKRWGGWRYAGDRDDCFFLVGRKCYPTEAAACKAAKCGRRKCDVDGAGPATVRCKK
jgi:hypothetical protein